MKLFFSILFLFSFIVAYASDDFWIRKQSPTAISLKNVFFINANTGWISGENGFIARTTNAGDNWVTQNTSEDNNIQSMHFINERLGWAVAWEIFPDSNKYLGTKILKTTDGGLNWTSYMYPDSNRFMKTICFIDSAKGFMAGAPLTIVYTTNAGATWNPADTDTTLIIGFPVENMKFYNHLVGYACGGFRDLAGAMWRTTNGGINWLATVVGPEPLNDIFIFNSNGAIAAGGDFEYGSSTVKTSDQGVNWIYDTLGTFGVATSIEFRTPNEGWIALGVAQKFSYTIDTGKSWRHIYTPDSLSIFDISFPDSANGWGVGYNGALVKYNYNMVNISNSNGSNIPSGFFLYQNYPNPFNPATVIRYRLNTAADITLIVYDALGKEIATLVNGKQNPGVFNVSFDGSDLPSGIYFYELSSSEFSEVNKMLLLK